MQKHRLLFLTSLIAMFIVLASCSASEVVPIESTYGDFTIDDYLMVDGKNVKNKSGTGDNVMLRGVNAGGYLVTEQWMCAIDGDDAYGYYDHMKITNTFIKRFGYERTLELWECYRSNFWTEEDVINCYEMGMNVIRLPFSHMSVDPDFNNIERIENEKYNFRILDEFIELCSIYGIYVILDMHGAYGSQNGQDHSGEYMDIKQVDFFSNEEKMSKTLDLWDAISNRYKDNPAVAGYDLLNEPGEKGSQTTTRHFEFYDRAYDIIRENGDNHIIIVESCWDGNNLPSPTQYGWSNVMYSFHNYSGKSDANENLSSMINKINGVDAMKFNVPFYMGEFNCYGNERSWELTLSLFNGLGWHWTSWTYKINKVDINSHKGWGIYITRSPGIKPNVDSFEEIKHKWFMIDNTYEKTEKTRFNSLNTLENVIKRYCSE